MCRKVGSSKETTFPSHLCFFRFIYFIILNFNENYGHFWTPDPLHPNIYIYIYIYIFVDTTATATTTTSTRTTGTLPTTAASATIEDLSNDLLKEYIFRYVGDLQFRFVAAVNRTFHMVYTHIYPTKRTSQHIHNIHTIERLRIYLQEVGRIKSVKAMKIVKHMVMDLSAQYGNMEIIDWFHTHHPNITHIDTSKLLARAALHGHYHGIQQLYHHHIIKTIGDRFGICPWDHFTCANAALHGHLDILQFVHTHGCSWDAWTCSNAALNGHVHVLKYAHEHGCPWTEHTCSNAALNGHLQVLEYARVNGCPWNEYTCSNAALNGHMEVLVYAHTRGCPWNSYTCSNAAQNGHLHILKYARMFNCPWTYHTVEKAMEHGHLDIARWACRNGCRGSFLFWDDDEDNDDPDNDDDDDENLENDINHYLLRRHDDDEDEVLHLARTILRSIMRMQNRE
jgi:hypothetical protein